MYFFPSCHSWWHLILSTVAVLGLYWGVFIYLLFIIFYWDKGSSTSLFFSNLKSQSTAGCKTWHAVFDQNYLGKQSLPQSTSFALMQGERAASILKLLSASAPFSSHHYPHPKSLLLAWRQKKQLWIFCNCHKLLYRNCINISWAIQN